METLLIPAVLFIALGLLTAWFFYKASGESKWPLLLLLLWTALHCILALSGFYTVTSSTPPRFALVLLPVILFILLLVATKKGRNFLSQFNLKWLTLLHTVRLPVEIGLYLLFTHQLVPKIMTFEGRNADIIAGITAPLMYYLVLVRKTVSQRWLLAWNLLCLGLLLNILVIAILALPSPLQQLAFDQPNKAVLYFPWIILPALIVPVVLFALVAAIVQLSKRK